MRHSFLRQRCWFNYIELQKKQSVGKHVSYRFFGTICWTDPLGNLCKQMMQMDKKRERERKTHRQREGAPVAVVISSSHIAGPDAFVSPLLSDQDNSIHFYFNSIFWSQTYLNGFILILHYYFFNTSGHWRLKQKVCAHKKMLLHLLRALLQLNIYTQSKDTDVTLPFTSVTAKSLSHLDLEGALDVNGELIFLNVLEGVLQTYRQAV